MSATSGICGGGGPHVHPQQGRPVSWQAGPFAARLAPTLIQKLAGETPAEFWVGLLVRAPNADGDAYEELACENYTRARVRLTPFSSQFDANAQEVLFSFNQGVGATHIGLFDGDGSLRFYGFLSGYRNSPEPPSEIRLRTFEVKVRRPSIYSGSGSPYFGGRPAA